MCSSHSSERRQVCGGVEGVSALQIFLLHPPILQVPHPMAQSSICTFSAVGCCRRVIAKILRSFPTSSNFESSLCFDTHFHRVSLEMPSSPMLCANLWAAQVSCLVSVCCFSSPHWVPSLSLPSNQCTFLCRADSRYWHNSASWEMISLAQARFQLEGLLPPPALVWT